MQTASDAANALSRRFRPALISFFLRRVGNYAEAEDLTQEVLVRVTQKVATIDQSRPDAYVFQIAANLLRDNGRRFKVRASYQRDLALSDSTRAEDLDPERIVQARQSLQTVVAALRDLPERTRTIFILYRLENTKQRDIADMLGVSVSTVEQHVMRASVYLRECLGEDL